MKAIIKDRRRIEFALRSASGAVSGRYLYDRRGHLVRALEGEPPAPELDAQLSCYCVGQPEESGYAEMTVAVEGRTADVDAVRFMDMTLGELVDVQAVRIGELDAVIDCKNNSSLTFRRLKMQSDELAKALIKIGVRKGEHVAMIVDSSWEGYVAKVGLSKVGAVIVNLNLHEKEQMLEQLLYRADIQAVIVKCGIKSREHLDMLLEMCPEFASCEPGALHSRRLPLLRNLITIDAKTQPPFAWKFEELLSLGESLPDDELLARERAIYPLDPATIIHTSGSTGVPKGVVLSHAQLMENAWNHVLKMELTERDGLFMTSPFFHSLGSVGNVLTCLLAGATVHFYDRVPVDRLLPILKKQRCTVLCGVPTLYIRLVDRIRSECPDGAGLAVRLCVTAGAPCTQQVLEDMKRYLGARDVMVMYGLTEAGPGVASTSLGDPDEVVVKTVGRLWPGVRARIEDLETREPVAVGATGEICIKGFSVMRGYYNNVDESERAIDADGWFHTGDIGSFSEDGLLSICGRCKDLVIHGGENISPREVEEFLRTNESIEDAVVVGVPDEQYGEDAYAFLKLAPGAAPLSYEDFRAWCLGKIATIKIPMFIEAVDDFPVLDTGKVSKRELRRLAAEHVADFVGKQEER